MNADKTNRSIPIVGLAVLLLGGGAAIAWFCCGSDQKSPPVSEAPPAVQSEGEVPTRPLPAAVDSVELQNFKQAGVSPDNCISYPDGTKLPPLNGVEKAPRIAFHRMVPFTKIVGKQTDSRGVEWYVHENGAMSTTRYQTRDGKREAVGEVTMPVATSGIVDK